MRVRLNEVFDEMDCCERVVFVRVWFRFLPLPRVVDERQGGRKRRTGWEEWRDELEEWLEE